MVGGQPVHALFEVAKGFMGQPFVTVESLVRRLAALNIEVYLAGAPIEHPAQDQDKAKRNSDHRCQPDTEHMG